jgi:hypothetical protein
MGLTLLFLDTHVGSAAKALYAQAGWTRAGVIPASPTGPTAADPRAPRSGTRELGPPR